MEQYLPILVVIALVGAGLVSGLLFAFSNFVMQALGELPAEFGQLAMQRINVRIINPGFFLAFMGTAAVCLAVVVLCVLSLGTAGAGWLLAGALAYLVGPVGITVAFNVPLNNALAAATREQAGMAWPTYAKRWLRWNHARTFLGVLAIALLGYGLHRLPGTGA